MSKKKKITLVPRLRFPEFKHSSEWTKTELCVLADKVVTRNRDNLVNRVLTNSALDGVVNQSDYFDRDIANHNNLENYYVIDKGDYVYNPRISVTAPVGPISKNKIGRGVMSPLYIVFRFKSAKNAFYEQYFKTNLWHDYLKGVSNTGVRHDRMNISNDSFFEMPLPCSAEEEQQKIADCLSSIDELIYAEGRKLSALRDHKKGLMQKLFPVGNRIVPEWRFSEFRDCGEWKKVKLSDVGEIITGSTPSTNKNEYYGGQFMFASPADISDKRYIDSTKTTLSELGYQQARHIRANSILFVCIGSTIGKLAQNREECATNQQINSLVPYENYNNSFIYFALEYSSNAISSLAGKQAVPIVNKTLFSNVVISVPFEKQEQEKIADCFSSVDELITVQAKKIETLKTHKKGLMQGLFPSIEEVSE